jgi:hypothetical protein
MVLNPRDSLPDPAHFPDDSGVQDETPDDPTASWPRYEDRHGVRRSSQLAAYLHRRRSCDRIVEPRLRGR